MFHIELRQFPHNLNRFNLSNEDLWLIVEPWVREKVFELEKQKWTPHQAKLIIIEGPELTPDKLTMARGWPAAVREGTDVTDQVLAQGAEAVAAADAAASAGSPPAPAGGSSMTLEAMGAQAAALLGAEPARLLGEWRIAAATSPELSPSESLAAAERVIAGAGADGG